MPTLRSRVASPLVIAAAAVLLRLAVGAAVSLPYADRGAVPQAFGREIGGIARSIAAGEGFSSPFAVPTGPTAFKAPVYPYLVAGVFALFGTYGYGSLLVLLALNCVFSALTAVVLYRIAEREFRAAVAVRAAWAWALLPQAVYVAVGKVWDTSLSALLLCLVVWMALRVRDDGRRSLWIQFALVASLAVLTNPAVLAPLPLVGVWLLLRHRRQAVINWRAVSMAAATFLVVIAPWLARNYEVFGEFVLIRSDFGLELLVGNSAAGEEPRNMTLHPGENPGEAKLMQSIGEIPYMRAKQQQALAAIAQHPGTFLLRSAGRVANFWMGTWSLSPAYLRENKLEIIYILMATGLSLLAFQGLRQVSRVARESLPFWGIILGTYPLVYYLTHPGFRYRHPLDPLLVVLAVVAVSGAPAVSSDLADSQPAGQARVAELAAARQGAPAS